MKLDSKSPKPLYSQLEEIIRTEIESNKLKPHSPIPSENALVERFGVSRMTIRRALEKLSNDGVIYRVQGKGAFVAEPKMDSEALTLMGLRGQLRQMGYETRTQIVSFEKVPATPKVSESLKIAVGAQVYEIVRMRATKDSPIAFDKSYLPVELYPHLELNKITSRSLYQILKDDYDLAPTNGFESLEVTAATSEEAVLLGTKKNSPLILLKIQMYHDVIPIEYAKVLFRGDKFRLKVKITQQS